MPRKHGKSFALNKIGQRFGRLVVISRSANYEYFCKKENRIKKRAVWLCRCDCGVEKELLSCSLKTGNTSSCGCYKSEVTSNFNKRTKTILDGGASINSLYNRYINDSRKGKRNYTFELTKERFSELIKMNCEYCGVEPYQVHTSHAGFKITYNGIDRVNPKEGYTFSNSVPCCGRCNLMKLDMDKEDFINICAKIVLKYKGDESYKSIKDTRKTSKERNSQK